ncbi:MAG: hypothetical protein GX564_11600 [Oligosphaeraceae bacterium]|nr:hypothetical protein [Oligosphaeraceae bacterium]
MSAQDKDSPAKYSNTLFSEQSAHSLDSAKQLAEQERRRRLRRFQRLGLPFCLLGLCLIAFLLRKPIREIVTFEEPDFEAIQRQMAEEEERHSQEKPLSETERQALEQGKKRYGNQDAAIIIEMRFPDELFAPEGLLDLAYCAVDRKPSEIGLVLEFRQPIASEQGENSLRINGQNEVTLTAGGRTRSIKLQHDMPEADFAAALEELHASHYGPCTHPLAVTISPELRERRRQREEKALPKIIPASSSDHAQDTPPAKTLVLPAFKAETSTLPQK